MGVEIDWEEVYILNARLIFANVLRVLNDSLTNAEAILVAIKPFFAVQFSKKVLAQMDYHKFRSLIARLRRSSLPGDWHAQLVAHIKLAWADDSIAIPFAFEEWRRLLVRFELDAALPFQDWIPILNDLSAYDIRSVADLAALSKADLLATASLLPGWLNILKLWQAACVAASGNEPTSIATIPEWAANASAMAAAIRSKEIDNSIVSRSHKAARTDLELPLNWDKLGPAARIRALSNLKPERATLNRFLNTGAQLNTLRQVQDSLRSVAAGIQCWASFCDLENCPYFPPTALKVLKRSAIFKHGPTFSLYLAHLGKACQLLNIPPTWYTAAVKGAAKGLENAQDFSLKFENYIFKKLFRKLIAHETLNSECGRLFYLAYVFILRLPSEALPAVRAAPTDTLLTRERLPYQSALGLRTLKNGEQRLVLKLRTRKHVRGGAVLMRPCFCDSDTLAGKGICPIHDFWRVAKDSALWGQPLFPSLLKRNINRIIKGTFSTMGIEDAHSYSTHAFRRGASMELKRCGDTLSQVLKTVGWNSATFRSYLSFVEDEEVNIRLILMNRVDEPSDDESEAEKEDGPGETSDSSSSASSTSEVTSESTPRTPA